MSCEVLTSHISSTVCLDSFVWGLPGAATTEWFLLDRNSIYHLRTYQRTSINVGCRARA